VREYNAQAGVTEAQIVLAAEITTSAVDWSRLDPMLSAAIAEPEAAGVSSRPEVALADTQYWNEEHINRGRRSQTRPSPDPAGVRDP
jgi:hypothetical protein